MGRAKRVFGYTDIHWSARDPIALEVADRAHKAFRPDLTVIGGDLLDCSPFSNHPSMLPSEEDEAADWAKNELHPVRQWLTDRQAETREMVWLMGNHDHWIKRWIANNGKVGRAIAPLIDPETVLSRGRKRFQIIPYLSDRNPSPSLSLSPYLKVVHGWTACKNAARKHLDLSRSSSIIYHHTHRAESVAVRDPFTHRRIEAFSAGCLCKLQPLYAHGNPTEWTSGFWIAYVGKNSHTAYSVPIEKGSAVLPSGLEVRV